MKLISTLIFLSSLITSVVGQQPINRMSTGTPGPPTIRIRCQGSIDQNSLPLLVIDGVLVEYDLLKKLNVNDIESIDILKDLTALAVYGSPAANGVVLITMETALMRKFVIRDFLTGNGVPLANICLKTANDSIMAVADETGTVVINKLKHANGLTVTVSSAGYKTFSSLVLGKEQEILLEREVKLCPKVVVVGHPPIRCGRLSMHSLAVSDCKSRTVNDSVSNAAAFVDGKVAAHSFVYPNPVQRSNAFNIEWDDNQDAKVRLLIFSMSGNLILSQSKKASKGFNRLSVVADARWAAGIYNIQLRNEKGTLVRQDKLVVQ